jgi:hypothetical protein
MADMVTKYFFLDLLQGGPDGLRLDEYVDAVAILLDHAGDASHLPFDPLEADGDGFLGAIVHRSGIYPRRVCGKPDDSGRGGIGSPTNGPEGVSEILSLGHGWTIAFRLSEALGKGNFSLLHLRGREGVGKPAGAWEVESSPSLALPRKRRRGWSPIPNPIALADIVMPLRHS